MIAFRQFFSQRNTNLQSILLDKSIKASIGINSRPSKANFSLNASVLEGEFIQWWKVNIKNYHFIAFGILICLFVVVFCK